MVLCTELETALANAFQCVRRHASKLGRVIVFRLTNAVPFRVGGGTWLMSFVEFECRPGVWESAGVLVHLLEQQVLSLRWIDGRGNRYWCQLKAGFWLGCACPSTTYPFGAPLPILRIVDPGRQRRPWLETMFATDRDRRTISMEIQAAYVENWKDQPSPTEDLPTGRPDTEHSTRQDRADQP